MVATAVSRSNSSASFRPRSPRTHAVAAALCLLGLLVAGAPADAAQDPAPKTILAFHWYAKDAPANVAFEGYLHTVLSRDATQPVEYYAEYIESNRFPGEAHARILRDYLRQKYADRKLDVVLAVGPVPIEFVLTYRSDLFPNTPIVFYTGAAVDADLASQPGVTGVLNADSYARTMELALRLQPDTTRAFVISGTPERERVLEKEARRQLEKYEGRVTVTYLTDLPLDQLIATVKGLPEHSIVLYSRQSQDEPGRVLLPNDFLTLIARASSVPVYDPWRSHLGYGMVGGDVDDMQAGVETAVAMMLRIASGTPPGEIPLAPLPKIPMFDARQLARWNIDEARLPPGSVVLFREPTVWDKYWLHIAVTALVLVVQAVLIGALLLQRSRRQAAETGLEQTRHELARVARVTTLAEFAASIAHELAQPLTAILANAQAGLRWVKGPSAKDDDLRATLADIADAARLANEVMVRNRRLFQHHAVQKRPLNINRVVDDIVALARVRLEQSSVSLALALEPSVPLVFADRVGLQQVLLNLILNGVEAMEQVDPRSRRLEIATTFQGGHVRVTVRDSGVGLAGVDLDRLFTAFYTTKPAGTGIGLSISRSIVEAHGGEFAVVPTEGPGATFAFTLPAADRQSLRGSAADPSSSNRDATEPPLVGAESR